MILRNAIVHTRPVTSEDKAGTAKVVKFLAQRGIAGNVDPAKSDWWQRMRTAEVAQWAADSANALMLEFAKNIVAIGDVEGFFGGYVRMLQNSPTANKQGPKS